MIIKYSLAIPCFGVEVHLLNGRICQQSDQNSPHVTRRFRNLENTFEHRSYRYECTIKQYCRSATYNPKQIAIGSEEVTQTQTLTPCVSRPLAAKKYASHFCLLRRQCAIVQTPLRVVASIWVAPYDMRTLSGDEHPPMHMRKSRLAAETWLAVIGDSTVKRDSECMKVA